MIIEQKSGAPAERGRQRESLGAEQGDCQKGEAVIPTFSVPTHCKKGKVEEKINSSINLFPFSTDQYYN